MGSWGMSAKYRGAPTIGWQPHEVLWLKAALTLTAYEFLLACEQISEMSGKTVGAISAKAKAIQREKDNRAAKTPSILKPAPGAVPEAVAEIIHLPILAVSKADRMAGRARTRQRRPYVSWPSG